MNSGDPKMCYIKDNSLPKGTISKLYLFGKHSLVVHPVYILHILSLIKLFVGFIKKQQVKLCASSWLIDVDLFGTESQLQGPC